jgi:Tfp pilus assembly protein PilN
MINLLSKETTRQIKAGHNNVFLMKCLTIVGIASIFLTLVSAGSYIFLINAQNSANDTDTKNSKNSAIAALNKSRQAAQEEVNKINASVASAQKILAQKISYSKILLDLAKNLPSDMVLSSISLDENSIGQPLTIKIYATSNANITQLKTNFSASTIFSNYSVVSTTDKQTDVAGHPTAITITVNINKGAIQ